MNRDKFFAQASGTSGFTAWLRHTAGSVWQEAAEHKFTSDVAAGTLPDEVLRRYLVQEYAFVETSVTVAAYALAKAPGMQEKAHLAAMLMGLTHEQEKFFRQAFDALHVPDDQRQPTALPLAVQAFRDFVVRVAATEPYEAPLTTMLAAEWMYHTWCQRVGELYHGSALVRQWVALHTTEAFESSVSWLREQLDVIGPTLALAEQLKLAELFKRTLELEVVFHDAPYSDQ